ncbi:helix-turn-helix domain-containing protein [Runella zeae]|uniref:helix-turn-helix domain-containing protein n=1 Tax=Runella zeae TaxID=94255 RepID=UPI0023566C4F|nr:helix-turn-helix transcriptional regulator [Runella zeae]
MEQTINQRIDAIISSLNMNQKVFAESLGKAPTVIYNIVNGRNKPGFEIIESLLKKYPQINSSWLLTGEGEMFTTTPILTPPTPTSDSYLQEYLKKLEERFEKLLSQKDKLIESQQYLIEHLESRLGKLKGVTDGAKVLPLWSKKIVKKETQARA